MVRDRIQSAASQSGRDPQAVRLVAATKGVSIERLREAIGVGLNLAGENRLQEALPKIEALQNTPVRWHFIGRLQRRKVRAVVGVFDVIHSVDSLDLAQEIDKRAGFAGIRQDILLEVNLGEEPSKGGFYADHLERVLPQMGGLAHVRVKGLMMIPPLATVPGHSRPYFRRLRELAHSLSRQSIGDVSMGELSMGMSDDFVVAIEEGATLVRLGRAIFGERDA